MQGRLRKTGRQTTKTNKNKKTMPTNISCEALEALLERFMDENPNGDSFELAAFMYDNGFEAGRTAR
jgi:hypothetical protein